MLDYTPQKKGPMFQFLLKQAYLECPNVWLSPKRFLVELVTSAQRSRSSKCAPLSAPEKRPHVSDFFEPTIFVVPQPMPFSRTFFWPNWSQWLADPGPPSVFHYPPRTKGPMFQIFLNQRYLECPNLWSSPKPFLIKLVTVAQRCRSSKCAILCAPQKKGPMFQIFLNQAFL